MWRKLEIEIYRELPVVITVVQFLFRYITFYYIGLKYKKKVNKGKEAKINIFSSNIYFFKKTILFLVIKHMIYCLIELYFQF